jgi:hypothetical protein
MPLRGTGLQACLLTRPPDRPAMTKLPRSTTMSATTLNTRAVQPDALQTIPSPLTPSDGRNTTILTQWRMSWAEWASLPWCLKVQWDTTRFAVVQTPQGPQLRMIHITG